MNAPDDSASALAALRGCVREASEAARVPYSTRPVGAALLLSDGLWVPGARVESASYPLTIPALLGAYVTATAGQRRDVRAAALSQPFEAGGAAWLASGLGLDVAVEEPDAVVFGSEPLPEVGARWVPFLDAAVPENDATGIALARQVAERAHVPASGFRVGCVLATEGGLLVPGCNVEHADWTRGLCAERTAVATAAAYGTGPVRRAYLSCPADPAGTPCGACRQLLVEYLPGVPVVMDRGEAVPETTTPEALLPDFFTGDTLRL
ncbi:MAG: cytidine deaminase [Bacteroidota bacterium]